MMNRFLCSTWNESICKAIDAMPNMVKPLAARSHFVIGIDPYWCGLSDLSIDTSPALLGRDPRATSAVLYPWHQLGLPKDKRHPTVYLAGKPSLYTAFHELVHIIDFFLEFDVQCVPVNDYAKINREEAFAEALCVYIFVTPPKEQGILMQDIATLRLFEGWD